MGADNARPSQPQAAALPLPPPRCHTYVIKVFRVLHDVRSPLVLLKLHPALPKELSANDNEQVNICFPFSWDAPAGGKGLQPWV